MKIIFAQGNPGKQYSNTRHNVGFYLIDKLADSLGASFIEKPKFHALIAEATLGGERVLFVKPTTYYNETGQSARAIVDFYKLDPATDFLVIHDELALPFGTIRTRLSGRDAGNNGVKSLNAHLGTEHARIRVGVYNDMRQNMHDADFVLGHFTAEENKLLPDVAEYTTQFVRSFVNETFEPTKVTV